MSEKRLVVCSKSGEPGCNKECLHRTPHIEHVAHQTDHDDATPCSMDGWCDDVGGRVRCVPHK